LWCGFGGRASARHGTPLSTYRENRPKLTAVITRESG
jgi:hypothetical protein